MQLRLLRVRVERAAGAVRDPPQPSSAPTTFPSSLPALLKFSYSPTKTVMATKLNFFTRSDNFFIISCFF